jgi:hypothetical protein
MERLNGFLLDLDVGFLLFGWFRVGKCRRHARHGNQENRNQPACAFSTFHYLSTQSHGYFLKVP